MASFYDFKDIQIQNNQTSYNAYNKFYFKLAQEAIVCKLKDAGVHISVRSLNGKVLYCIVIITEFQFNLIFNTILTIFIKANEAVEIELVKE